VAVGSSRYESLLDGPQLGHPQRRGSGGHVLLNCSEYEREEHPHAQLASGMRLYLYPVLCVCMYDGCYLLEGGVAGELWPVRSVLRRHCAALRQLLFTHCRHSTYIHTYIMLHSYACVTLLLCWIGYDIPSEGKSAWALEMDDMAVVLRDCTKKYVLIMLCT